MDAFGIRPSGFRLPDATHVGMVRLAVGNLDRSLEYYTRVLGFSVVTQDDRRAALSPLGETRALVELEQKREVRRVPRGGLLGLYHFAILLPDRSALGRFAAHLAGLGVHAGSADHAVSEAIYLS